MEKIQLGNSDLSVSRLVLGCQRMGEKTVPEAASVLKAALAGGINFFDHADIYDGGESEVRFGEAFARLGLTRQAVYLQSKCGIRDGFYDLSPEHIMESVEGSLKRLGTDYLDVLLLHRPDALMVPEEVGRTLDDLKTRGMVRWFGVSNHSSSKLELAFSKVTVQPVPIINQLQLSLSHADILSADLNCNRSGAQGSDHTGYVLDYCQTRGITVQAWSPLQRSSGNGSFIGAPDQLELNAKLSELAVKYSVSPEAVAIAWLLRHPAKIQPIIGTMNPVRITALCKATQIQLTRQEWYGLYRAGQHFLP